MQRAAANGQAQALLPDSEGGRSSACSTLSSPDAIGEAVSQGLDGLSVLLECDSIVLRLRTGDTRLSAYLCREDVMGELVRAALCVHDRLVMSAEDDARERAIRRALVACEILCCEQPAVISAIQSQPDAILVPFWALCGGSPLQSSEAIEPGMNATKDHAHGQMDAVSSACWARLLHMAAVRVPAAAGRVLIHGAPAGHRAAAILARAEDSPPVVEGVVRLFAAVGATAGSEACDELFEWLRDGDMLGRLLAADTLCAEADHMLGVLVGHAYPASFPVHRMLAAITDALCAALPGLLGGAADDFGPCPRLAALADVLERIAMSAATTDGNDTSAGSTNSGGGGFFGSPARGFVSPSERRNDALALAAQAASAICPALPAIAAAFSLPSGDARINGAPRLGMIRMRAAQIAAVAVALAAYDTALATAIVQHHLPARLIALCFAFPSHSLLHCATVDFVRRVCALTGAVSDALVPGIDANVCRGSSPVQSLVSTDNDCVERVYAALFMLEDALGPGHLTERIVALHAADSANGPDDDKIPPGPTGILAVALGATAFRSPLHGPIWKITSYLVSVEELLTDSELCRRGRACLQTLSAPAWRAYLTGPHLAANARVSYVLGGVQNDPTVLCSDVASDEVEDAGSSEPSADEELARFFCQQVLSSLPDRFRVGLTSEGDSFAANFLSPRLHSAEDDFEEEDGASDSDSSSDSDDGAVGGEARHFVFDGNGCAVHVDSDGRPIPGIAIPLPGMFSSELSFDGSSDDGSGCDSLGDSADFSD